MDYTENGVQSMVSGQVSFSFVKQSGIQEARRLKHAFSSTPIILSPQGSKWLPEF